jgi:hypothetical protein
MKSKADFIAQRILLLIKLDAQSLFNRIKYREVEYLQTFALKRTRSHFPVIFANRYRDLPISDLKHCGEESLIAIDAFYNKVEETYWYLNHTEDMPNMVEDKMSIIIKKLEHLFDTMNLYLNVELGYQEDTDELAESELHE